MTLTIRVLGLELLFLDLTTDPPEAEAEHQMPSGGATGSQPVGYFAALDVPDFVAIPARVPSWDDRA